MSDGNTNLMRTRCPGCGTMFRVTSEQLRRKAGNVRCGHCQTVFNALEQWQGGGEETQVVQSDTPRVAPQPPAAEVESGADEQKPATVTIQAPGVQDERPPAAMSEDAAAPGEPDLDATLVARHVAPVAHAAGSAAPGEAQVGAERPAESPEQSTQAAREAGLVAARELAEVAGYDRWSAGALAGDAAGSLLSEQPRRAVWPFALVSLLLLLGLAGQLLYYFRTEIVVHLPSAAALYELAEVEVPLPRDPTLVAIETSDLQADSARGLYVLQATLKSRATHAQDWPALELSLTDTNDAVVARKVIAAADYLPPDAPRDAFPANGEQAVKLWIEAKGVAASGYRLYVFYP